MAVQRRNEGQDPSADNLLKDVVRVIVDCSDYAMESRIHNLAFLAEWEYIQTKLRDGEFDRITDVVYKPQFEGVRSDELHLAIDDMVTAGDLATDMTTVNERLRTVYHLPTESTYEYPNYPWVDVVEEIARKRRSDTIDELVKQVQRTEPYQNASFEEPIRFRQPWETI